MSVQPRFGLAVMKPYRGWDRRSSTGPNDATPIAASGPPEVTALRRNAITRASVAAGSPVGIRAWSSTWSGSEPIRQTNFVPPASIAPNLGGSAGRADGAVTGRPYRRGYSEQASSGLKPGPAPREYRIQEMPPKSRKVTAVVRIQQPAGAANVAKVGQVLGAYGINIVQVMKDFNEATEQYRGLDVAADITIHEDRSTIVVPRTPTTSSLIKRAMSMEKGSSNPGTKIVGKVPSSVLQNVARQKFPDLNTDSLDEAVKIVAGSVRSMGLAVED